MSGAIEVAWITGACAILASAVALIPSYFQRRKLREVHDQVKNTHGTNLRDDLDRVIRGIDWLAKEVRDQGIDLAWERRERLDMTERIARIEERRLHERQ